MDDATPAAEPVPEGFKAFGFEEGFVADIGPIYYKRLPDGTTRFGMQTGPRHINPNGVLHGGVFFGFADTFMGRLVWERSQCRCATITLTTEFVASGKAGQWIEGAGTVTRETRSLAFVRGEVFAGDELLMQATGVWRIFRPR
jgi:uncharacterized protein (TIGR00369 family)